MIKNFLKTQKKFKTEKNTKTIEIFENYRWLLITSNAFY